MFDLLDSSDARKKKANAIKKIKLRFILPFNNLHIIFSTMQINYKCRDKFRFYFARNRNEAKKVAFCRVFCKLTSD